jgi:hypothetical protein
MSGFRTFLHPARILHELPLNRLNLPGFLNAGSIGQSVFQLFYQVFTRGFPPRIQQGARKPGYVLKHTGG